MPSQRRQVKFTIDGTTYTMQEMLGRVDDEIIVQNTDPATGLINNAEVWFKRINLTVIEPPIDSALYSSLSEGILRALKLEWEKLNAPKVTAAFLPPPPSSKPAETSGPS